jgi:transposase
MITAGIDVSAKELVVVVQTQPHTGASKPMTFENNAQGHQTLIHALKKRKVGRISLEATGVYHLDLAVALYDHGGIELMVLNPKAAKQYADAVMNRTKTDGVDAALLAGYAQVMPFQAWKRPETAYLNVRACARRLSALTQQRAQSKNHLHALEATQSTPDFILADVRLSVAQIDAQIDALRAKSLDLIAAHAVMAETLALLLSVKGIGEASAIQIMGEILVLPEDMTAKQWVAMAGLDLRHHQSGSSVHKKTRITKVGNRYLRHALYMPALSAARYDTHVRGYYQHLIADQGLKKIQAVCAVMRKLLHAIHAMLQRREPFDNTRFYALPERVA